MGSRCDHSQFCFGRFGISLSLILRYFAAIRPTPFGDCIAP